MKLALSSAASPGVALDAFYAACRARGLDGIERVIDADTDAASLAAELRAASVRVVALRADGFDRLGAERLARLAGQLAVPISVPVAAAGRYSLRVLARLYAEAKATLLLGVGTDLEEASALSAALRDAGNPLSLGIAWELRPSTEDLASSAAVLLAIREKLRLVRLHGGGPEQRDQDGRGIGPLFVDLALAGYAGSIVLTPSRPEELPRWRSWLASQKPAGCGSAHPAGELEVDVRDVEPRDRLGTILGAFRALATGAKLHITLDHDPSCMYYALEESEPAGTFAFRKIGDGPEVWHAEVTKLG